MKTVLKKHNILPRSEEPHFSHYYYYPVSDIIVRSSQLEGCLQTLGCVDMMATEDTPTYCDFIKIFEEQNKKNNGQRERKHLQQNTELWNLDQNHFIALAF